MTAKDIMHVGAVLGARTEPCDVKLAQLSLLRQLNVVAKIAVVSLEKRRQTKGLGREF